MNDEGANKLIASNTGIANKAAMMLLLSLLVASIDIAANVTTSTTPVTPTTNLTSVTIPTTTQNTTTSITLQNTAASTINTTTTAPANTATTINATNTPPQQYSNGTFYADFAYNTNSNFNPNIAELRNMTPISSTNPHTHFSHNNKGNSHMRTANSTISVPYGAIGNYSAGYSYVFQSRFTNNYVLHTYVNVTKSQYPLNFTLNGQKISKAGATYVYVPVIGGHLGTTGGYNITINASGNARLPYNNKVRFSYGVKLSNGTIQMQNNTSSSADPSYRATIPLSSIKSNVSVFLDMQGNNNYTSVDPVGVLVPTYMPNYVNITLYNAQSAATVPGYAVPIVVNSLAYKTYEYGNLQNLEFFYPNGTVLISWMQYGDSNTVTNTLYFVSLPASLPADSNTIIALGFAPMGISLLNGAGFGGAAAIPTFSSATQYGFYDSGSSVFPFYSNFAGNTLPSIFQSYGSGNYFVNNGITITGNNVIISTQTRHPNDLILELNTSQITAGGGGGVFFGTDFNGQPVTIYPNDIANVGKVPGNIYYGGGIFCIVSTCGPGVYALTGNILEFGVASASQSLNSQYPSTAFSSLGVTSFGQGYFSPSSTYIYVNSIKYSNLLVGPQISSTGRYYYEFGSSASSGAAFSSNWIRARYEAPNLVDPTATFNTVAAVPLLEIQGNPWVYGTVGTIVAESATSSNSVEIIASGGIWGGGTTLASSTGRVAATFSSYSGCCAVSNGPYTINAFDSTAGLSQTSTLTLAKGTPNITETGAIPVFPAMGYNDLVQITVASAYRQLAFNVFVNNLPESIMLSGTTTNTVSIPTAPGLYTITVNTLGDGNYIAYSQNFTVNVVLTKPILSIPDNPVDFNNPGSQNIIVSDNVISANLSGALNTYIATNQLAALGTGTQYTVSFWTYWRGQTSNTPIAYGSIAGNGYGVYLFRTGTTNSIGICGIGSSDYYCPNGDAYNAIIPSTMMDNWTFISIPIALNNGALVAGTAIYINGINQNAQPTPSATQLFMPHVNKFYIGDYGDPYNSMVGANFSNVQFYVASESATQISELYQEGIHGTPIDTPNLRGWWLLNGTSAAQYGASHPASQTTFGNAGGTAFNVNFGASRGTDWVEVIVNGIIEATGNALAGWLTSNYQNPLGLGSYTINGFDTNSIAGNIITLTVNPALSGVSLAVSNTPTASSLSYETLTANIVSGTGTPPYTYSFLAYNSITNALISNGLLIGSPAATNTYTFQIPSYWATKNTFYANVFITDSATPASTARSALSAVVTVKSLPITGTPSPFTLSNTVMDVGQYSFANTLISGGVNPYAGQYSFLAPNNTGNCTYIVGFRFLKRCLL